MKLILGSSSGVRKKLLEEWGFKLEVVSPNIDEKEIRDTDIHRMVVRIASAKADAVARQVSADAVIIASDSVTVVRGILWEKPRDKAEAYEWLREISDGLKLTQVSSVVVLNTNTGERLAGAGEASVIFNPLPEEAVRNFVEGGQVLNHAGAYAIQDTPFKENIREIAGEYEVLVGLPKTITLDFLNKIGFHK